MIPRQLAGAAIGTISAIELVPPELAGELLTCWRSAVVNVLFDDDASQRNRLHAGLLCAIIEGLPDEVELTGEQIDALEKVTLVMTSCYCPGTTELARKWLTAAGFKIDSYAADSVLAQAERDE